MTVHHKIKRATGLESHLIPSAQPMPRKDKMAITITTAPTIQIMRFMSHSLPKRPMARKNYTRPTSFKTAMTMTMAPTSQTMLYITVSSSSCEVERRALKKVPLARVRDCRARIDFHHPTYRLRPILASLQASSGRPYGCQAARQPSDTSDCIAHCICRYGLCRSCQYLKDRA